jgi:hypothetical protein
MACANFSNRSIRGADIYIVKIGYLEK